MSNSLSDSGVPIDQMKEYFVPYFASYKFNNFEVTIDKKKMRYNVQQIKLGLINYLKEENLFIQYVTRKYNEDNDLHNFFSLKAILEEVKIYVNEKVTSVYSEVSVLKKIHDIHLFWAHITGLNKILPLLIDPQVEEIFSSSINGILFLDHAEHGRLVTNIILSQEEILNILYRTSMENSSELNKLNPSIRGEIAIPGLFHLRVTGDLPPFSAEFPVLNIRKLHQKEFTVLELIKKNTMDLDAGAFLKVLINNGVNLTIIGTPTSGKTTLQNALLEELPNFWKIFSFEHTIESKFKNPNYFKFKILNYLTKKRTLTSIVSQLLHRSPDYVNLGEITTSEEASAWISCISAGIPVIQTIHSLSNVSLLPRLVHVFHIEEALIASSFPHVIVELNYFWSNTKKIRKLISISELTLKNDSKITFNTIASFSMEKDEIMWFSEPKDTKTFAWLKKHKNINISSDFEVIKTNFNSKLI